MPTSLLPQHIECYRQALQGNRHLIGWGVQDSFYFHRWQERFPLECFVDTNCRKWDTSFEGYDIFNPMILRSCSPETHSVINYYRSPWVEEYAKKNGGHHTLAPLPYQHIMRALTGKKSSDNFSIKPMPLEVINRLMKKVKPSIGDNLSSNQAKLISSEYFEKNLSLLGSYDWKDCVAAITLGVKPQNNLEDTVCLVGNSLCTGGAERQMVNLAVGFHKKGWATHSLSLFKDTNAPHYVELLQKHNIPMHHTMDASGSFMPSDFLKHFLASNSDLIKFALWHLPLDFASRVAHCIELFNRIRPKLVVAYLDWPSTIAGIAAALCGVPHIILSGRNYPPPYFPHFFEQTTDSLREIYQILALHPRVHLTNNSVLAAQAYSEWLSLPSSAITNIPNCLTSEFLRSPNKKAAHGVRKRFGLKKNEHKIVLGVFRLSPEKRPEKFLSVIASLVKRDKSIRALLCGDGILRPELEKRVKDLKLEKHVIFLGAVSDVPTIMALADILLHTAAFEGMPNALLEAQAQGLPIVSTRTGGVEDCLAPELRAYCFAKNDWRGVTNAVHSLLINTRLRRRLGAHAQRHARREYSIAKLVSRTVKAADLGRLPKS